MQEASKLFATRPSSADLKMKRANEYAAPTHNASTTKAYSVSLPVWTVWSQLSNSSTNEHTRQVTKITVAIIREARARMASSIAHQVRKQSSEKGMDSPTRSPCERPET